MKHSVFIATLALAGCANFQPVLNTGIANVKAADDNVIAAWTATACGTPIGAAIRHPEIVPALKALCLPAAGADASPATLLDGVKK